MTLLGISTAVLSAAASIPWTRDHADAFRQARERRQPVLLQFTGPGCGGRSAPGAVDSLGRPVHETSLTDCERMQADVWESASVAERASRFEPVLVDGGDPELRVRYQVVRMPTVL
ncbi:MAG TPA: hypothetical protein VGN09_05675, partial [Vicinamibacteria bacterium]